MRLLTLSLLIAVNLFTSLNAFAKIQLSKECKGYTELAKSSFVLFNKQELIELGVCVSQDLLRRNKSVKDLRSACKEAIEVGGPLGIMALSKAETIQIGQCVGAINYTSTRYHNVKVREYNYRYRKYDHRNKKYICSRGNEAIKLVSKGSDEGLRDTDVRELICDVQ